jgi:beta-glucuronidase
MLRMFAEHTVRPVTSLDGLWDFAVDSDRRGRSRRPRRYPRKILVPSAWEQIPGLENYRGRGWLRTNVTTEAGTSMRLVFGGVSHTGTVYVDGRTRGRHYDAFTPWDVLVPGLSAGEHELVVEVDNTFGPHSPAHRENDYYTYGGITRPVEAQLVPGAFIERLHAVPRRRGKAWELSVRIRLRNWTGKRLRRGLRLRLAGQEHDLGTVTIRPRDTREVHRTLERLALAAWSPERPTLHTAVAELLDGDEVVDDLIDRIGLRETTVRGRKILLTGEPIRLRGFNRHEDHPQFGCAIPPAAMANDLHRIRDLGGNFIRTSHYPNDMRFLDLCDEMGFCVWEESHCRNTPFDTPGFEEALAQSTREMIDWHLNRPCIVMWGCLNECESHTRSGRAVYRRIVGLIRKLDGSRPVTFADNKRDRSLCAGLGDIVSWNLYDAWYSGWATENVEPNLKRLLKWLHSPASRGGRGKPVILSEFGAGAIYGCRQRHRAKWSEEYQADALDECLRVYLNHPAVAGAAIWQFCDCRVTHGDERRRYWGSRPRTMNNKGVVDEHRRPKLACEVVRRRMHEAARAERRSKR